MPGPQTQHKGTVYGDDENAPEKPGLGPPVRHRPQHAHRLLTYLHADGVIGLKQRSLAASDPTE